MGHWPLSVCATGGRLRASCAGSLANKYPVIPSGITAGLDREVVMLMSAVHNTLEDPHFSRSKFIRSSSLFIIKPVWVYCPHILLHWCLRQHHIINWFAPISHGHERHFPQNKFQHLTLPRKCQQQALQQENNYQAFPSVQQLLNVIFYYAHRMVAVSAIECSNINKQINSLLSGGEDFSTILALITHAFGRAK